MCVYVFYTEYMTLSAVLLDVIVKLNCILLSSLMLGFTPQKYRRHPGGTVCCLSTINCQSVDSLKQLRKCCGVVFFCFPLHYQMCLKEITSLEMSFSLNFFFFFLHTIFFVTKLSQIFFFFVFITLYQKL